MLKKAIKPFILLCIAMLFSNCIESNKDYMSIGNSQIDEGEMEMAIETLTKAIENSNDSLVTAHAYFKRAYAKSRNITLDEKGQYQRNHIGAVRDYSRAINYKPDMEDAYFNRGISKGSIGDFRGAIADFEVVLNFTPDNATAYRLIGKNYKELGDLKTAVTHYDTSIKIDTLYSTSYFERAELLKEIGNRENALNDYNKAVTIDSSKSDYFLRRGEFLLDIGKTDSACMDFSRAGEISSYKAYELIDIHCN